MNVIVISILLISIYFLFIEKNKFSFKSLTKKGKKESYFHLKSKTKKYEIHNLNRGVIGIGGAGSGKTYSLIEPLLSHCIEEKGVLSFDPKGDLTPLINKTAKKFDKPILNFSLDDNFDKINPINLCQDKSDIIDFSSYFLSGIVGIPQNDNAKYFFNSAKSVLTGVIIFLKNKGKNYATIPHIIAIFLTIEPEQLIQILGTDEEAKRSATVLRSVGKDPKLLGSIISTFTAFFSSLDTPKIFRNLNTTEELNLPNNPNNPSVINLIFNLQKRDLYTPIYSSIVGLILKKMNKPEQYESAVIIDEFTCLSIPDFQNIPETARSNKIATCIAVQDLSQLVTRYGKDIASSIVSNMGNQFLFRTTSPETLRHFSDMLGTREEQSTSKSKKDFDILKTKTVSVSDKKIINNEKILNFDAGMVWGIIAEGNNRLIEGERVNGNHYMKNLKDIDFELKKFDDEDNVYKQVYREVAQLIKPKKVDAPKKFNL
ncbi:type IV secretory system conjugative DNA transfer family protein [Tenacibaculum finnmarkense]|uniref:type IV secretory system conjugative DNA transfer family protein n=1 Tax=Tenacibaculum finnmarkense TaxID=2781243 RepID=UPI001EFB75C8|nr:type IV secretory system conjugative DNA transfer family protein [Tenacibaculum finnmarkense]MCG8847961.1 type IV secretory system conjugative DNA transfer family protein [Tenacibaculum finnmarkense]MCG8892612.1 type IV secretory system conjugative DNA transfer family protein [Tenacibaculum finnmarkense]MCG8901150.1 type IV secretory system conjugative DNA transfer family protein [Tenacibaculum finnmarkense]